MKVNLNRKLSNYPMLPGITKYIFLTIAAVLVSCSLYAQSPGFVQQDVIKQPNVTTDAQINALTLGKIQTTRVYIDGLGRTVQTVAVQASPVNNKDIVQPAVYNTLGQQTTGYLPYTDNSAVNPIGSFRTTAVSEQLSYYQNSGTTANPNKVANETTYPFSQQVFENSPLQRVLTAGMPGLPGGKSKSEAYRLNNNTQDGHILIWSVNGTYTTGSYYLDNSLSVTDGIDEDGVETLAFADAAGHMVLKRQRLSGANVDTYYVYSAGGVLSYIIPPLALAKMVSSGDYSPNDAPVSTMVFKFVYDSMSRLIQKTVPAKGAMSIVYDPLNRPVLMQDALMNSKSQWNYVRYDAKGRAVSQGIYTDTNSGRQTQSGMQNYVSTIVSYTPYYETRNTVQSTGYYTAAVFPTTLTGTLTPLAYAYFDDYKLNPSGTVFTYVSQGLTNEETATTAPVKGMPTMVRKATVGAALTGDWLLSVTFYDKRLNPIQTRSNNQLYYTLDGLTDYKTTVPDFMGVPQIGFVKKVTSATTTTTVQTNLTYDYMYRIKTITQSYNGGATVGIAAYTYNEMGQLVLKNLGQVSGATYLQNLDMRYNIRGMLTNINNSTLSPDALTNGESNDVFGMQILYDKTDSYLGNTPSYSGRVSGVKWMSKDNSGNNSYERAFKYYYDGMNRDTAAIYAERNGTGGFITTHGWDEDRITYDQGGNIKTLYRNSTTQGSGSHTTIDNLTYSYSTTNPNKLSSVADASGSSLGFMGGTGTYTYDVNGNLTNEPYKGISHIYYNYLNRTDKMTFTSSANRYIDYTYDAGGNLIRKRQYDDVSGVLTLKTTTDYIDGFVYLTAGTGTPVLSYFAMPEGRVIYSGSFAQEYIISDQQGNARVSFNNTGAGVTAKVVQENSYYAFGLIMPGTVVGASGTPNKQLYNGGSEWQNDYSNLPDYYQTFYRNYDAAIARWVAVDPMAESAESMTSYQYAGDNPVMNNDPLGNLKKAPQDDPMSYSLPAYASSGSWGMWGLENDDQTGMSYMVEAEAGGGIRNYGDYSAFWSSALSVASQISNGLEETDQNGWHFSGSDFTGLVGLVQSLGDDEQVNLFAYSDGSTGSSLQINSSYGAESIGGSENATANYGYGIGSKDYAGNIYHLSGNIPADDGSNRQYGNTCVFFAMSPALAYYGKKEDGYDILGGFIIDGKEVGSNVSMWGEIVANALPGKLLSQAYSQYLTGYFTRDGGVDALFAGNPLIGTYRSSPSMSHDVFITGISFLSTGMNYAFWNPATGSYGAERVSSFYRTFVVTGIK